VTGGSGDPDMMDGKKISHVNRATAARFLVIFCLSLSALKFLAIGYSYHTTVIDLVLESPCSISNSSRLPVEKDDFHNCLI
jgi:hypothetical protein